MDSVPTAESQIFLTDSGKLKSMAYPCLISAYLGKATTEYKHFTEFNQYRQNAHPEDVGIGFDILDDYYTLSELINSNYNVKDSLKKNAMAHVTLFTCPPR